MTGRLEVRVAIVTGAGRGIGPPEQVGAAVHDRFMAMLDSRRDGLRRPAGMIVELTAGEAAGQIANAGLGT